MRRRQRRNRRRSRYRSRRRIVSRSNTSIRREIARRRARGSGWIFLATTRSGLSHGARPRRCACPCFCGGSGGIAVRSRCRRLQHAMARFATGDLNARATDARLDRISGDGAHVQHDRGRLCQRARHDRPELRWRGAPRPSDAAIRDPARHPVRLRAASRSHRNAG